ncbi:MAG: DNA-binding protein [Euryarchaeota archaeon]|nr:DNA-binding protein [Euryarchaeota archaeon]MDE1880816.1 DNA-binding protein [Euryarchaeota archaeon]
MERASLPAPARAVALRLDPGEEVTERLSRVVIDERIEAGFVTVGIGSLRDTTLGYWDGRAYVRHVLSEPHELLTLAGSVARLKGEPHLHLHATLSDKDGRTFGGHFFSGKVAYLVELLVQVYPTKFGRAERPDGLKALTFECP